MKSRVSCKAIAAPECSIGATPSALKNWRFENPRLPDCIVQPWASQAERRWRSSIGTKADLKWTESKRVGMFGAEMKLESRHLDSNDFFVARKVKVAVLEWVCLWR